MAMTAPDPRALAGALRAAGRAAFDFALPPRCPACGIVTADPHRFCLACWQGLHFLGDPCCARCGLPFEHDCGDGAECGRCLADPPRFDRLRAAVAYGDIARRVALKLKYGGRPGVAETLARLMQRHLGERAGGGDGAGDGHGLGDGEGSGRALLLVPVPLHRWRIWKRGYNQSALLAAVLARRTGVPLAASLLRRTRATPPLRGLGRRERALAVRAAFDVAAGDRPALRGRTVVLVDDVFTSGATAAACALALKRAGAARVEVLCWARVIASEPD